MVAAGTPAVVGLAAGAPVAVDFAEVDQTALHAAAGAVGGIVDWTLASPGTQADAGAVAIAANADLLSGEQGATPQWPSCHKHCAQWVMPGKLPVDAVLEEWCYNTRLAVAMFALEVAAGRLGDPTRVERSARLGEESHRYQLIPEAGWHSEVPPADSHHTPGLAVAGLAVASVPTYPARKVQEPDPAVWMGKRFDLERRQPRKTVEDM